MTALRDELVYRLRQDLVGPMRPDEVLTDYPTDVYLTGILFPQRSTASPEEDDNLQAEGAGAEGGDTSSDQVQHVRLHRPASFGVSFALAAAAGKNPRITIRVAGARYQLLDSASTARDKAVIDESTERVAPERPKHSFRRVPFDAVVENLEVSLGSFDLGNERLGLDFLRLNVTCTRWDSRFLVTVTAINVLETVRGAGRVDSEEKCLFQTELTIAPAGPTTRLCPRPIRWGAADEDSESAKLLYRDAEEYAVGHTCSADWAPEDGETIEKVRTSWTPTANTPAMSSSGMSIFSAVADADPCPFSALALSSADSSQLGTMLSSLVEAYQSWLNEQATRVDSLEEQMADTADTHLRKARTVASRMLGSIDLIKSDPVVCTAFRLANRAIAVQRQWSTGDDDLQWRPFQLAFILLALESVADRQHVDRDVADLIWFPTGGGKTEAYLGLIAFCLFFRRLQYGEKGAGVAAIMRYTLRLLTIQQFQRAVTLISACEAIRLGDYLPPSLQPNLGDIRFSIGLWVGSDSVPNTVAKAHEALKNKLPSTPRQLTTCPCAEHSSVSWYRTRNPDSIKARCSGDMCRWNGQRDSLPVYTVDEDVYRERPSLIIGTIDKFAQIVRNPNTGRLFGCDGRFAPPDLIVQDELHLISGPLGTVAGLYETAIDELCSSEGTKPKIVASTATIRAAKAQIRALFNRGTCLFPPAIIDASNSGFAVVDYGAPGRLYVGVTTAGRSAKYTLQAVAASLLQAAASAQRNGDPRADWYSTLVAYFNSLRELGGALVLMQDDVERTLAQLGQRWDEQPRDIHEVTELTSRVSSSEVRDILDKLELKFGRDGAVDVLLASNMISVGVDISRLGMMIVNGQPKSMAEYIQSTSRVGRGQVPGIVVTIYNDAKSRDRSHFETFRTWHDTIYRDVEATSVTPFSSRARDRALHAALIAIVRHQVKALRDQPNLLEETQPLVETIAERIVARAREVDTPEAANVDTELARLVLKWRHRAGLTEYWNDRKINTSLLISAEEAARRAAVGQSPGQAWPTPNSMRNVEASTTFVAVRGLRDDK